MKKRILFLIVLLVGLLGGGRAFAQTETPEPRSEPIVPPIIIDPPIWRMEGLEIPYQRVDVTIDDQVATTHIEQLFRNPNDWLLEGTYLFPLPEGAAVSQLTMWVDGVPIEAKLLGKDEARGIYDEIVRQLRDPALLEYVGHDAIQANVFPIPPGDERLIEIEYSHLLPADNGLVRYVFPQSADLYTTTPLDEQRIRVEVNSDQPIRTIYSPSHAVAVTREGEFAAVAGYEDVNVVPDRDFELFYTVSPDDIGLNLLTYKEPGEDGFFLLLVAPGIEPGEVVAKDVILVLDTSGSMEGEKMAQAKEAAAWVVDHLNDDDRFNIVAFSTGTSLFENELLPATSPGDYEQFINSLEAVGGTNISEALLEAAAQVSERPATIIFLTDGLATEGITDTGLLLDNVAAALPDNARLFAFGVGDDVDTTLLDTLAQNHRGTTTYVRPGQAIDEAVSSFYAKVGSPVLTDLLLDMGGIRASQQYPDELPDLFAGSQLVVAGRYRDGGPATITLTGTANGRQQTFTYDDQSFSDDGGEAFIPRLWATRAIGHMMQQIRLRGEDEELVRSIVNLSTRYGIITPYTSFLIEEDDIFAGGGREVIDQETLDTAAQFLAAPTQVSGAEAVERAVEEEAMADAAAPMVVEVTRVVTESSGETVSQAVVRAVGSKTFLLRDGVYVDTAYDPDSIALRSVPFASGAYFDLLVENPALGPYLALAERVIVVHDGQGYEITAAAGETGESPDPANETALPPDEPIGEEVVAAPAGGSDLDPDQPVASDPPGVTVCGVGLILPLLGLAGFGLMDARRRKRREP